MMPWWWLIPAVAFGFAGRGVADAVIDRWDARRRADRAAGYPDGSTEAAGVPAAAYAYAMKHDPADKDCAMHWALDPAVRSVSVGYCRKCADL